MYEYILLNIMYDNIISDLINEIYFLPTLDENTEKIYYEKYNEMLEIHDKEMLDYVFYANKKYIYKEMGNSVIRDDKQFRKDVIAKYNNKCIISNNDIIMCDVAHIIPFCEANEFEKYDVNNGLLLSSELHKLFDKKLLKINPETRLIEIDNVLLQIENNKCNIYHNKEIVLDDATIKYLSKIY